MRQEEFEHNRSRRVRRSSGREYAEIMRGHREPEAYEDDIYEDDMDPEEDPVTDYREVRPEREPGRRRSRREADETVSVRDRSRRAVTKKKKKGGFLKILLLLLVICAGAVFAKGLLQGNNWTVAVFGVDSREGTLERGTNSDVIMLVNIDKRTGDIKLVSVYRDTYLKINDEGEYHKINEAYAQGGHKQAVKALEENLDIRIDDYVTFSWAAVAKGINALGGVDIELSDAEFYYINAFITETVQATGIGSTQLSHAGMNHLDGVQAVAYGRLRLMDTDFNRTARQRKVISLAMDKAKAADAGTLTSLATAILPEVSTSVGLDDLQPILKALDKFQISESTGFPFARQTAMIGSKDCVIPTTLESNVVTLHQLLYGEEDYQPSQRVKAISQQIAADSGFTEAGENAPEAGTGGGSVSHRPAETEAVPETAAPAPEETSVTEESTEESESVSEESTQESGEETETASVEETEENREQETGETTEVQRETEKETKRPTRPAETSPAPEHTTAPEVTEGPGAGLPDTPETVSPGPGMEPAPEVVPEGPGA